MLVMKSGLIFLKDKNNIIISPGNRMMKRISADNINDIWREMKYIDEKNDYQCSITYELLAKNRLAFEVPGEEKELYYRFARNVQHLANLQNNPFSEYKTIVNSKVLIIGAGTVGSALIKLMSKYGMNHVSIVEGDDVAVPNITAQLLYEDDDIGQSKAKIAKEKIYKINKSVNVYVNQDNIHSLLDDIKPEYVFCCADDSGLVLHNLLIDNISNYGYTLFIAGYSYNNLLVDRITNKEVEIFKKIFAKSENNILKENTIYHNTGTIVEGYLSAAFMMQVFLDSFKTEKYNHYSFDTRLFEAKKQQLKILTKEEEFNADYDDFVAFQKDESQGISRNALSIFGRDNKAEFRQVENDFSIVEFRNILAAYNRKNGNFTEQYRKALKEKSDLSKIRENIRRDVYAVFSDKYLNLVNRRKNTITRDLSKQLESMYTYDFMSDIIRIIKSEHKNILVDPLKMLQLSVDKLDKVNIPIEEALLSIMTIYNSPKFSKLLLKMMGNSSIDYYLRPHKNTNNMTVFNPIKGESNVIVSYDGSLKSIMTLSHELSHAFFFDLYKQRLNCDNFKCVNNDFWEVLARVGELLFISKYGKTDEFALLSQYNLTFCILDYMLAKQKNDYKSLDEIIEIKSMITEFLGLNRESMYYIDYNFILFPFLYESSIDNYRLVYQDAVALSIFKYLKKYGVNFDGFYKEIADMPKLDVSSLLCIYKLDIRDIISQYTGNMLELILKIFSDSYDN